MWLLLTDKIKILWFYAHIPKSTPNEHDGTYFQVSMCNTELSVSFPDVSMVRENGSSITRHALFPIWSSAVKCSNKTIFIPIFL